jgi:general secretion pathway protein G
MLLRQESKRQRRAGFTLMEMLVVVAIIVALAGIGGFFLMGALSEGQKGTAAAQVKVLTQACMFYATKHNGAYPEQLADLLKQDDVGGPYLDDPDALMDPWSKPSAPRPYQYDKNGTNNNRLKPDIWTVDPKDNVKIGNWPKSANIR